MATAGLGAHIADTDELRTGSHEQHKLGHLVRVCPHRLGCRPPSTTGRADCKPWGQKENWKTQRSIHQLQVIIQFRPVLEIRFWACRWTGDF
jgi:hypothetical protein